MTRLNDAIFLSFLPVGHTKFSPDWCFGLLKQQFRQCDVNCLDDLVAVVNTSATCNTAQLVGTQSGDVIVPTYNWSSHFSTRLKKIPNITSYHHFKFHQNKPAEVDVQEYSDSPMVTINILKKDKTPWDPSSDDLPAVVHPAGLSEERQVYLYEKIREYCSPSCRDLVCPKPSSLDIPSATTTTENVHPPPTPLPTKTKQLCSKCHQPGHNARSCKQ